jgi:hypothetical protein
MVYDFGIDTTSFSQGNYQVWDCGIDVNILPEGVHIYQILAAVM